MNGSFQQLFNANVVVEFDQQVEKKRGGSLVSSASRITLSTSLIAFLLFDLISTRAENPYSQRYVAGKNGSTVRYVQNLGTTYLAP